MRYIQFYWGTSGQRLIFCSGFQCSRIPLISNPVNLDFFALYHTSIKVFKYNCFAKSKPTENTYPSKREQAKNVFMW